MYSIISTYICRYICVFGGMYVLESTSKLWTVKLLTFTLYVDIKMYVDP
jgi:hypothetical protein